MCAHYGHLVRILHWCCDQTMTEALNQVDLTASQGRLMAFVAHRGQQPTYARDVEAELHLTHPTVSGLLARLEQKGFVEGFGSASDRRVKLVRITASGAACCGLAEQNMALAEEELLSGLTETERDIFNSLLRKVRDSLR